MSRVQGRHAVDNLTLPGLPHHVLLQTSLQERIGVHYPGVANGHGYLQPAYQRKKARPHTQTGSNKGMASYRYQLSTHSEAGPYVVRRAQSVDVQQNLFGTLIHLGCIQVIARS